jgi:hypothetical protein
MKPWRWLMNRYGLTDAEASRLEGLSDRGWAIQSRVDDFAREHGCALASPLARGYLLELLDVQERRP